MQSGIKEKDEKDKKKQDVKYSDYWDGNYYYLRSWGGAAHEGWLLLQNKYYYINEETARENFYKWLETEKIVCEPRFQLTEYITLPDSTSSMSKSLYQTEGKMDGLEYKMALAMTNMDNIRWWHRNPERNKFSFCLNGFRNHYPDFIVRTISGKIILIETKGDQLENAESREKIRLGRAWQDAAGKQAYRYYMVFQNKDLKMEGAYRFDEFLTLLREL